jgi:soluble lytic murein transglycosylase-like protein
VKRLTLAAGAMLAVSVPAVADAKSVTPRHARQYARLYHQVAAKLGRRAPGRNIVRWGTRSHAVTDAQVVNSIGVLERMLAPTPAVTAAAGAVGSVTQVSDVSPAAAGAGSTPAVASAASTGSPLPACTWQPESGGNPSAVNASSGAGGYYQIMPSTWAAYGGSGAPQTASMSEQTAVAQRIYQSQGPSAWSNC